MPDNITQQCAYPYISTVISHNEAFAYRNEAKWKKIITANSLPREKDVPLPASILCPE